MGYTVPTTRRCLPADQALLKLINNSKKFDRDLSKFTISNTSWKDIWTLIQENRDSLGLPNITENEAKMIVRDMTSNHSAWDRKNHLQPRLLRTDGRLVEVESFSADGWLGDCKEPSKDDPARLES